MISREQSEWFSVVDKIELNEPNTIKKIEIQRKTYKSSKQQKSFLKYKKQPKINDLLDLISFLHTLKVANWTVILTFLLILLVAIAQTTKKKKIAKNQGKNANRIWSSKNANIQHL